MKTTRRTSPVFVFFFNDTATTEIYTLSLHDALPICARLDQRRDARGAVEPAAALLRRGRARRAPRSEEHTSELQSQSNLVCRLLLEKKKKQQPSRPSQQLSVGCTSPRVCWFTCIAL